MPQFEIPPFTLILPVQYQGHIYDRGNESADELKKYLAVATGGILKANQLGQLASGLVHGQVFRNEGIPKLHLYGLSDEGKGITFADPEALYYRWSELEKKVGPTMQHAMCNIIEFAVGTTMEVELQQAA